MGSVRFQRDLVILQNGDRFGFVFEDLLLRQRRDGALLIAVAGMTSRFLFIVIELLRNCERNWFGLSHATAGSHCVDRVGPGLGGACCGERQDGGATTRRCQAGF